MTDREIESVVALTIDRDISKCLYLWREVSVQDGAEAWHSGSDD